MTRPAPPCGTRKAENTHRRTGAWPCYVCLDVRTDVIAQIQTRAGKPLGWLTPRYAPKLTFGTYSDAERMEIAAAVHRAAETVEQFAKILGLAEADAVAFSADLDRIAACVPVPAHNRRVA